MGLDNFTSGSVSNSTISNISKNANNDSTENQKEDTEPFKIVGGDREREKVFQTEEDWKQTKEFIEDEMDLDIGVVMDMEPGRRHEILHKAILGISGKENPPFHCTDECIVCGEDFVYPRNWNFTRLKGEAICNDHSIGEAVEKISSVNASKV